MHRGEWTHLPVLRDVTLMAALAEILSDDLSPKPVEFLSVCEERSVCDRWDPHTISLYFCSLPLRQWLGLVILRANGGVRFYCLQMSLPE